MSATSGHYLRASLAEASAQTNNHAAVRQTIGGSPIAPDFCKSWNIGVSDRYKGSEELLARTSNFMEEHLNLYVSSGGTEGHIMWYGHIGIHGYLPALTSERWIAPSQVVQDRDTAHCYAGEWVIVGSKGGAPEHPVWYLNLCEQSEVTLQVGTQAFRAHWRCPENAERDLVWDYIVRLFPNYATNKSAVARKLPVVVLKPFEPAPLLGGRTAN